ncbi:MAG: hypothetical protein WCL18_10555 [bacterium]
MYRAFFMILQDQLPYIDFSHLPAWIQATYEPFSGLFSLASLRGL